MRGRLATATVVGIVSILAGALVAEYGSRPSLWWLAPFVVLLPFAALVRQAARLGASPAVRRIDGLQRIAVALLCLALITSTWNGVRALPGVAVSDVFFVGATIVIILRAGLGHQAGGASPRWLLIPAYALAALAVAATLFAGSQLVPSLVPALRLLIAMTMVPLVIAVVSAQAGAVWLAVDCWLLSVGVNAVVAVCDYYIGTEIGTSLTGVDVRDRVAGLTSQYNHLAFAVVFALPILLTRWISVDITSRRLFYGLVGVLSVFALIASGSRAGVIGLLAATALVPIFVPSARTRSVRLIVTSTAVVLLVAALLPSSTTFVAVDRLAESLPGGGNATRLADAKRLRARDQGIEQFQSSPVYGVGFSTIRQAHNLYVQFLAASGILGLLAFATYMLGAIRSGLSVAFDRRLPTEIASLAGAGAVTLATWLVMGVVANQIDDRYLYVPLGFLLAAVLVARQLARGGMDASKGFVEAASGLVTPATRAAP